MSIEKNKWYDINKQTRVYAYPCGQFRFKGVIRWKLSDSGNHYLDLDNGNSVVVAPGWLWFRIIFGKGKSWTVN